VSVPTHPHNDSPIRIVRALPNPPGAEDRGEWVELRNMTAQPLDLSVWRLADQQGRPQPLEGSLAAGETKRCDITRADPNGMQLRNAGGWILLFERDQRRAAVRYERAAEGEVREF
jgi:poly(U)-specific endoribonuclease